MFAVIFDHVRVHKYVPIHVVSDAKHDYYIRTYDVDTRRRLCPADTQPCWRKRRPDVSGRRQCLLSGSAQT